MVKTILAVLFGMLLQAGLAGLRTAWRTLEPAAREFQQAAASAANRPEAFPVAVEPDPPGPDREGGRVFAFPPAGCVPIGGVNSEAVLAAAAEALGLTPEALRSELENGRSLAEVAEDQGVTRETLAAAIKAAAVEAYRSQLDEAVAAGKLTQAQADERLGQFEAQDFSAYLELPHFLLLPSFEVAPFGGEFGFALPEGGFPDHGEGFHFGFSFGTDGAPFMFSFGSDSESFREAAAQALGLSPDNLAARLDAGESLSEIAEAQGVPIESVEQAVKAALLDDARAQLDEAVAAGTLSQDEADRIYGELEVGIDFALFDDHPLLPLPEDFGGPFLRPGNLPGWLDEALPESRTD